MTTQIHAAARVPDNNLPERRVTFQQPQEEIYEDMTRSDAEWTKYSSLQFKNGKTPTGDSLVREVKTKTNAKVVAAVTILAIICLVLVAIALVMAGITMISNTTRKDSPTYINNSSVSVEALESHISQLRQELHTVHTALTAMQQNASVVTTSLDRAQAELGQTQAMVQDTQRQLESTQAMVQDTQRQLESTQAMVQDTQRQLENTQAKVYETEEKLEETRRNVIENDEEITEIDLQQSSTASELIGLTNSVTSLTRQQAFAQGQLNNLINTVSNTPNTTSSSEVQLYQNCYTDTANTRLGPVSNTVYKRRAKTPNRVINVEGFYTLSVNCHYECSHSYTVIPYLRRVGQEMYCYCTVINHGRSFSTLTTASNFYLDCTMSITRCPLTQTI